MSSAAVADTFRIYTTHKKKEKLGVFETALKMKFCAHVQTQKPKRKLQKETNKQSNPFG